MKTIYQHYIPLKIIFLLELVIGMLLLVFFIYLIKNDVFLDIWMFAGPLLSVALILTGLTSSKIEAIKVNANQQYIEIDKASFFSHKRIRIKIKNLKSELKTANGKKNSIIPKLRLIIFNSDEEIEELGSNFLGFNNSKLKRLHKDIKEIVHSINC